MKCKICDKRIKYGIKVNKVSHHSEVGDFECTLITLCDECYDKVVLPAIYSRKNKK